MSENKKLERLMIDWGYSDLMKFLEDIAFDSISPGICLNPGCDYSTEVEPDSDRGYCEICNTQSVKSALRLAGIY